MMKTDSVNKLVINGAGGGMHTGGSAGNMMSDPVGNSIQKQIENANEKLQQLSSDEKMSLEDKMKKRQEIQQEIASLNRQLRQHQIEQRRNQSTGNSMEDYLGGSKKTESVKSGGSGGMSQAGMQAIISADATMKQARVQGSVVTKMEGRAEVLKAEIKQDKGRNTESKEAELAEVEHKAMDVNASRMNTIADVNNKLNEASKTEKDEKTDKDKKADNKTEKTNNGNVENGTADKTENNVRENGEATVPETVSRDGIYSHVDVSL